MEYKLSEPYRAYLYFPFLKDFNQRMHDLFAYYGLQHIDFTDVSLSISETLDQIHLPDFVFRFDEWLKNQPESSVDRYISYFKDNNDNWAYGLRNRNEYISRLSDFICLSTLDNITNFLDRLINEHEQLVDLFGCPSLSTKGCISLANGDRHEGGQQPVVLCLGKFKVIYKPRDSGIDNVLNEICSIIGMQNICPATISRKTHLWQIFVENKELNSKEDASVAFSKYGSILAIADLFNINDCHFDNFIVDADTVWLVDPETSFQYFFDDSPDFERSVYQSGLLQSPDAFKNGLGHTSALTAITNIFQSFTYPHAINDATENIQVRYEGGIRRKTQNYPRYNGKPVRPVEYIDDVIDGYISSFNKIKSNKSKVISFLKTCYDLKPRYLVRTTAYYLLVINKIINPENSINFQERLPVLLDEYLCYRGSYYRFQELIPYESHCLTHYDIPIFYLNLNSKSLFDGDNKEFQNFFPYTPLEQIESCFSRWDAYLLRQKELITRSINVLCEAG